MVMLDWVFKALRLVQLAAQLGSCRQGVAETAGQVLLATCWAELSSRERHPRYSSGTWGSSLQEGDSKEGVLGHWQWPIAYGKVSTQVTQLSAVMPQR